MTATDTQIEALYEKINTESADWLAARKGDPLIMALIAMAYVHLRASWELWATSRYV